jgi:hypothetical protein
LLRHHNSPPPKHTTSRRKYACARLLSLPHSPMAMPMGVVTE